MENKTHFGFQQVDKDKKKDFVKDVFDSVAPNYDIMNDVMSFFLHPLWKKRFVDSLASHKLPKVFLDVAGGSGDITRKLVKKFFDENEPQNTQFIMSDINYEMLSQGQDKLFNEGLSNISYLCADGHNFPFDNNSIDIYTISFGLRNFTDIQKALEEAYRILKPGGQFHCLEFSPVDKPILKKFYDFYSFQILPLMGKYIAKDEASYQYLAESIRMFPRPHQLKKMMEKAGFEHCHIDSYSMGIVSAHSGWKL